MWSIVMLSVVIVGNNFSQVVKVIPGFPDQKTCEEAATHIQIDLRITSSVLFNQANTVCIGGLQR
jgi:hypothetical protein